MKDCPCHHCTERFIACSDRCPKDERGEYGYKAWRDDMFAIKKAQRQIRNLSNTYAARRAKWARIKKRLFRCH